MGLPIGVSVLCPAWVRTQIFDAERNWPGSLGQPPPPGFGAEVVEPHLHRAVAEGLTPMVVADLVADAVTDGRFLGVSASRVRGAGRATLELDRRGTQS